VDHPKTNQDPGKTGEVRHNPALHRYEMALTGGLAVAEYALEPGRMIIAHTFVPPPFRGQGIADKIVRYALDDARARQLQVVPACSFVAAFIRRHPEYRELLAGKTAG
jgi:uncharacterized protein